MKTTIGQTVRKWRQDRELSVMELARRIPVSRVYLHRIEKDQQVPTLLVALRICRALAIPVSVFEDCLPAARCKL